MAKIKIIIEDDNGEKISEIAEREYYLDIKKGTLGEIEEAVEIFKQRALVEIEKELLEAQQTKYFEETKKKKNTKKMEKAK